MSECHTFTKVEGQSTWYEVFHLVFRTSNLTPQSTLSCKNLLLPKRLLSSFRLYFEIKGSEECGTSFIFTPLRKYAGNDHFSLNSSFVISDLRDCFNFSFRSSA